MNTKINKLLELSGSSILKDLLPVIKECVLILPSDTHILKSHLGGLPHVTSGFEWPKRDSGKPLSLLAELFLSELPDISSAYQLPKTGVLQVWFDMDELPCDEADGGFIRWIEDASEVVLLNNAPDNAQVFPDTSLRFEVRLSLLDTSHAFEYLGGEENGLDWDKFCNEIEYLNGLIAQIAVGKSVPLKSDGQISSEAYGYPFYVAENHQVFGHMKTIQDEPFNLDEKLILQIIADWGENRPGFEFADGGMLWWFMSAENIKERRFDKAWYLWSCN